MIPRAKLVRAVGVVLALLLAGYSGWWWWLAGRARTQIDQWLDQRRAAGWTVATGATSLSGFPLTVRLGYAAPVLADAHGDRWEGPPLTVELPPWRPDRPVLSFAGHHLLALAGRPPLAIDAASATATPIAGPSGGFDVALTAGGVAAAGDHADQVAAVLRVPPAPADHTQESLELDAGFANLSLAVPPVAWLGGEVAAGRVSLRVMGALSGLSRDQVAAWNRDGGTIEIDSFTLSWAPLDLSGNATLALDAALQPELAGTVKAGGVPALAQAMAKSGALTPRQAMLLAMAAGAMAKGDSGGAVSLPVTIQDQALAIGPLVVMRFPAIAW